MSKDLSSNTQVASQKALHKRNYIRGAGFTAGVVGLFIGAQIIGVAIFFSVLTVLGYDRSDIQELIQEDSVLVQFIAALCVQAVTIAAVYLLLRHKKHHFWKFFGLEQLPNKEHVGLALVSYALYIVAFILILPVVSALFPAIDTSQMQQLGFESPAGWELIFVFITLVIFPPFVEEIVFRGVLFRGLKKYVSVSSALIVSSVIFGMAHLEILGGGPLNYIAAIDTAILAVFLTYVYIRSNSLWPAILLHAIKNSIAFVVLFII